MTPCEQFLAVLEGRPVVGVPFFPDITDWYAFHRTPRGEPRRYGAAQFVPDHDPIHSQKGTIPAKYATFTLLDFYRRFDWGFHAHIGDWYETVYANGVKRNVRIEGTERIVTLSAPRGVLVHRDLLAADGTWAPVEHFVKTLQDLDTMAQVVEATSFRARYDRILKVSEGLGAQGIADLVIYRSPFGKLVHEYMGFDRVVYALHDEPDRIHDFLRLQEAKDLEVVQLAAGAPARLVIISDHADENLIAPPLYRRYCIPFYRKACEILHAAGKFVSTHLDGNFKGFFPFLAETGFDLLDGCTPAPMFNYTVEELAAGLPAGMKTYCGVPAILFCQRLPTAEILRFADRILAALTGRCILNVGDILPPDGDIEQVIALGEHVKKLA
ncbi:MAG: uroporphyrinogen decarboxylase family protein [Kiritimatiellia bacterium]